MRPEAISQGVRLSLQLPHDKNSFMRSEELADFFFFNEIDVVNQQKLHDTSQNIVGCSRTAKASAKMRKKPIMTAQNRSDLGTGVLKTCEVESNILPSFLERARIFAYTTDCTTGSTASSAFDHLFICQPFFTRCL